MMARRGTPLRQSLKDRIRDMAELEEASIARIARAMRLSRTTVYKYLRRKTCEQD